jgi:hypothetical protein
MAGRGAFRFALLAAGFPRTTFLDAAVFFRLPLRVSFRAAEARPARFADVFRFFFLAIVSPPLSRSAPDDSVGGIHLA